MSQRYHYIVDHLTAFFIAMLVGMVTDNHLFTFIAWATTDKAMHRDIMESITAIKNTRELKKELKTL